MLQITINPEYYLIILIMNTMIFKVNAKVIFANKSQSSVVECSVFSIIITFKLRTTIKAAILADTLMPLNFMVN